MLTTAEDPQVDVGSIARTLQGTEHVATVSLPVPSLDTSEKRRAAAARRKTVGAEE